MGALSYRVWYFASLRYDEDQRDNAINARRQQVQALMAQYRETRRELRLSPENIAQVVQAQLAKAGFKVVSSDFYERGTTEFQPIAARLANEVGTSNVAGTAKRLGITSKIQLDPSMALGAVEVSPMEMAQAYAPFSNGGFLAKGYGIESRHAALFDSLARALGEANFEAAVGYGRVRQMMSIGAAVLLGLIIALVVFTFHF